VLARGAGIREASPARQRKGGLVVNILGCGEARRAILLTLAVVVCLAGTAFPAMAQTPASACAQDSLVLVSPDGEGFSGRLTTDGRMGVTLKWAKLDNALTSCAVPVDTGQFDFQVQLSGDYRAEFDRNLIMTSQFGGVIGSTVQDRVVFSWTNANQQLTGAINGEFNLSNNGGFFLDSGDGWGQANNGLPRYLPYTDLNVVAASEATPGLFLVQLSSREFARGLWRRAPDGAWQRIAPEVFVDGLVENVGIRTLAFAPDDDDLFAVGTVRQGIFVTSDGGQTFTQVRDQIDAGSWSNRPVTALTWSPDGRIYCAIRNLGLFVSADDGQSFSLLPNMVVPNVWPDPTADAIPNLNRIWVDADDGAHLLVADNRFGVYESTNAGAAWTWLSQSLLTSAGVNAIATLTVAQDPAGSGVIFAGTDFYGLWRTADGGATWTQVLSTVTGDGFTPAAVNNIVFRRTGSGRMLATAAGDAIHASDDLGLTWSVASGNPGIRNYVRLGETAGGDLWLTTQGGGIYIPGTPIPLRNSILPNLTDAAYRALDFGVSVTFTSGTIEPSSQFQIKLQDFQGYAVWRSDRADSTAMQLIGLYDRNNPETCLTGYCGSQDYNIVPGCYAEKRSACFDFTDPDTVRYFDADVYDGFVYYYAVTTFDYGNTAIQTPASIRNDMLFSPRYVGDPLALRLTGDGNLLRIEVNIDAAAPTWGPEIMVVPNPLRSGAGFPEGLGELVQFRNLPPESRVLVYTLDGDLVADLGPDLQEGHNMPWTTRNDNDDLLASGVYIWKVEMPEREDFYGKLVIIR